MEKNVLNFNVEEIIKAWKEMEEEKKGTEFLEFQKMISSSSIGTIFELRGINLRDLFEKLQNEKLKKTEEEIRKEFSNIAKADVIKTEPEKTEEPPPEQKEKTLSEEKENHLQEQIEEPPPETTDLITAPEDTEKKKTEDVPLKMNVELLISKINEHQNSFEKMKKKVQEEGKYNSANKNEKYPLIWKLKLFTVKEILKLGSYGGLATWIEENKELVKKDLGLKEIPETRVGIYNVFYQSERTTRNYLLTEIKNIVIEITSELENSKLPEKKEEQKSDTAESLPTEEKKIIVTPTANAKLIISKINERQSSFEEMQNKITKNRIRKYPEKHTIAAKIKAMILMRLLNFSRYAEFAKWIKNNEDLFENLGFGEIPEKEASIISLFYCFKSSWMEYVQKDTEKIIAEIESELQIPVDNKIKPDEEKQKIKKSVIMPELSEKLIVSKINERQKSFERMEKEMLEKMGSYNVHQNEKYPVISIFKLFTIKHFYGFVSYARLAIWIEENKELVIKNLGFEDLPKTKTEISNLLNKSEHAIKEYFPKAEIKKIAMEITNELKIPREKEFKPLCHLCRTSDFVKEDKGWKERDEENKVFRWVCNCGNSFVSRKKPDNSKNDKPLSNLDKSKEDRMEKYAWGLYNLNGHKNIKEIIPLINKQFLEHIDEETVSRWIQEKIKERNGLTCGQMNCFAKNENSTTKNCKIIGLGKIRGKDELICDAKLEELTEKGDNRLNPNQVFQIASSH